jgi:hypothetical protein
MTFVSMASVQMRQANVNATNRKYSSTFGATLLVARLSIHPTDRNRPTVPPGNRCVCHVNYIQPTGREYYTD